MWLRKKYGDRNILKGKDAYISAIDTVSYARNVLAYIPRNALDNGATNISEYKWTGYRAMFCNGNSLKKENDALALHERRIIAVKDLTTRMVERFLHTGDNLGDVPWLLNSNGEIIPASACDWQYLEMIFNHNQAFFMRMIGSVNTSEMTYISSANSMRRLTDQEFLKRANEYSLSWYKMDSKDLPLNMKVRFLEYLGKKMHLSVAQVARCLQMERELVTKCLGKSLSVNK